MMDDSASRISVVVIDDHPIIRDVTRRVLAAESDIEVVAEFGSVEAALRSALSADVVILDLSLPGRGGLESIADVGEVFDAAHVLVLTMHADRRVCAAALDAGAKGFIGKGCHPFDLVAAVRAVAQGEQFVPADLSGALGGKARTVTLSPDEATVVRMLADGWRLSDLANKIGLGLWEASAVKTSLETRTGCRTVDYRRRNAVLTGVERPKP